MGIETNFYSRAELSDSTSVDPIDKLLTQVHADSPETRDGAAQSEESITDTFHWPPKQKASPIAEGLKSDWSASKQSHAPPHRDVTHALELH